MTTDDPGMSPVEREVRALAERGTWRCEDVPRLLLVIDGLRAEMADARESAKDQELEIKKFEALLFAARGLGTALNYRLRRALWLGHGCDLGAFYGDDDEMRCGQCRIDFKREPIDELEGLFRKKREDAIDPESVDLSIFKSKADSAKTTGITVTASQFEELRKLAKGRQNTYGRHRTRVQNSLVEKGLARFCDDDGGRPVAKPCSNDYRAWCEITEAGRTLLEKLGRR